MTDGPLMMRVVVTYDYPVNMEMAERDYGTTEPMAMAVIDQENLANGSMLVEDLSTLPYQVVVAPVEQSREPQLLAHRRELLRAAARWQRSFLASNPQATASDLIAVIDPDKEKV